jgi:hypothetical protein
MPTIISGDTGVNQITAGAIEKADLPTGSVLQVVSSTDSGSVSSTTSTFTNTGLTASITPTSATSKILVLIYQGQCGRTAVDTQLNLRIQRDSTTILSASAMNPGTSTALSVNVTLSYLDSPATTSSITYSTQLANRDNVGSVQVNINGVATIILMEIAA